VLPEIEQGAYTNLHIAELPHGLEAYYRDHWIRMGMQSVPPPTKQIRIIYLLSESPLPISRALIARYGTTNDLRISELDVQTILDNWKQFLHELNGLQSKRFSIYHTSFQEFLHQKEVVQAAGVEIKNFNELFANAMWDELYE
jgi:hypothetical protein